MSEYVMIPVPEHRVMDVYALLADGHRPAAGLTTSPEEDSGWTEAEIRRCYRESPDVVKTILATLAANPGVTMTSQDLAAAISSDYTQRQFAGAMGAFNRRVQSRYGKSHPPFAKRWDHAVGSMVYVMDARTAAVIADEIKNGEA